jgi:uncharacterized protein (DUF302 family)
MKGYGRRLVAEADFETTLGDVCRTLREEGLQVLARSDLREHFWNHLSRNFRQYVLLEAWSPDIAFEALRHDPDVGSVLPARFAVYALNDERTVVVAFAESASPLAERERVGRVLARLEHEGATHRYSRT